MEKQKLRALIDTGASCSLMNSRVLKSLKNPPKLSKQKVSLQAVNGEALNVEGSANFEFEIGGTKLEQKFYIVSNMNRNIILGTDFLTEQGIRIYFDLKCIRVGKIYVPLENDIHISSIVRIANNKCLKPQSANICIAKIKNNSSFVNSELLQISAVDSGYISSEPGLIVTCGVTKLYKRNRIPILILNNTNKSIQLKRNCVVGRVSKISSNDINTVTNEVKNDKVQTNDFPIDKIDTPPEHMDTVKRLLEENSDIFAADVKDLKQTDLVEMRIDVGNHRPIKMKPYRIAMHKLPIVDKAIDEMLEAGIIRRSKSPWSFPIVIVDKKDGTKRFCVDFRQLNKITKPMSYPLPLIDDLLAKLGRARCLHKSGFDHLGTGR